jgi:hypothetical protein
MSEADYETIEAAVMETVRGRWFLAEFARRSRVDEMRQMLDAIGKLEHVVREQQGAPADPSIRLLVQRLKEVARGLERTGAEMRQQGLDERFCVEIDMQARAVAGLLRVNPAPEPRRPLAVPEPDPRQALPPIAEPIQEPAPPQVSRPTGRAALERLDQLSTAEKLALFA